MSSDVQIAKGREAMKYFHNQASKYSGYALGFDQMLDIVGGGGPKTSIFLEGLGFAIESTQADGFLGGSKVESAMEDLADSGAGRLPSSKNAFFKAISDGAQNTDWVEASKFVVLESSKEIGTGLVDVGNTITSTLKSLGAVLPIAIVGAVLYVIYSKAKKVA